MSSSTIISPQHGLKASLTALMQQLEQTQWLSADLIVQQQYQQLNKLVIHAANHSPYFQQRLQATGIQPKQLPAAEYLSVLPIMSRRDLQSAGESLFCQQLPRDHLPIGETRSSGSSGEPVIIKRTALNKLLWFAFTMREHLWQQRDFSGRLAVIRAKIPLGMLKIMLHGDHLSACYPKLAQHMRCKSLRMSYSKLSGWERSTRIIC